MSSIVKIATPSRTGSYLGIGSSGAEHVLATKDLMGILMKAGRIVLVGGKNDGTEVTDGIVEANQHVLIYPAAPVKPARYHTFVSFNAKLLEHGLVSTPGLVEPGHGEQVLLAFKASKKTDLNEFSYIFSFNMVD